MPWPESGILEPAFWRFHEAHPEVYMHLLRFAVEWRQARGPGAHLGISALWERVRWEIEIASDRATDEPKLNNSHRASYARLLMHREPDLRGIFVLRQQRVQSSIGPINGRRQEVTA